MSPSQPRRFALIMLLNSLGRRGFPYAVPESSTAKRTLAIVFRDGLCEDSVQEQMHALEADNHRGVETREHH